MPAAIGGIWINQINSGGNAIFGDAPLITPKSATKTFSGSGGGNTGIFSNTFNMWSFTNTLDPDVNDENVIAPGPGVFAPLIPPIAAPLPVPVPSQRASFAPAQTPVNRLANGRRGKGGLIAVSMNSSAKRSGSRKRRK